MTKYTNISGRMLIIGRFSVRPRKEVPNAEYTEKETAIIEKLVAAGYLKKEAEKAPEWKAPVVEIPAEVIEAPVVAPESELEQPIEEIAAPVSKKSRRNKHAEEAAE